MVRLSRSNAAQVPASPPRSNLLKKTSAQEWQADEQTRPTLPHQSGELQVIKLGAVSEVVVHSLPDEFRGILGWPLFQIDTQRQRLFRGVDHHPATTRPTLKMCLLTTSQKRLLRLSAI